MPSSLIVQVKHSLNIRSEDYFIAYGMGHSARMLVDGFRDHVEVSAGLVADKGELLECEGIRTKIYESVNDIGGIGVFDKVYCNFFQLPVRKQHHDSVLSLCHKLCAPNGIVLVQNMFKIDLIHEFVRKMHLQKYWHLNNDCDILFKKDSES